MALFGKQPNLKYGTYYSSQSTRSASKKTKFLFIGLGAAAFLGISMFVLSLNSSGDKSTATTLSLHENSLLNLGTSSQKSIRDDNLSTANSNMNILLLSDVTGLNKIAGISSLSGDQVKLNADTNGDSLNQALLNNNFDRTYRQVVIDKVSTLLTEAQNARNNAGSKLHTQLDLVIANLTSISQQFTQIQLQ